MINYKNLEKLEIFIQSLSKYIGDKQVRTLSDNKKDIKISTDKILHKKIKNYLEENFDYSVLSEENITSKDFTEYNSYYWIIDPLDGSLNHSRDIPISCISIALWNNVEPIYGLIYDINIDELFSGIVNSKKSVQLNGKEISVSNTSNINRGVLCTGFPSWRDYGSDSLLKFVKKIQNWKKIRLLGSAALSLAWVACGRTDAYIEEDIRIWDVAAGLAIVKAAGGEIICNNNKNKKNFVTAVATNKNISAKELL